VKTRLSYAFLLACSLAWPAGLFAQNAPPQLQLLEEERRKVLDQTIDTSQDLEYDFGGWLRAEFINFDDAPYNDQRTLRFYDLRIWGSARVAEIHRFYARLLMQYTDFNQGDQYGRSHSYYDGPNLDQGFYEIDLAGAGIGLERLTARGGRQFFQVGRGIALNGTMDGLSVDGASKGWGFKAVGAITIGAMDDIDSSRPNSDDSHRLFCGLSVESPDLGAYTHAYAYGLAQFDLNGRTPPGSGSFEYGYDSQYWGIGARSQPLTFLDLRGEIIFETGRSYPDPYTVTGASAEPEPIQAFCLDLVAEAHPALPLGLRFSAEYLWGSGDRDRLSVTNTVYGNEAGTADNGFLAFGYVNTGISLYPRPSNLHILRIGAASRPLASVAPWLETLDIAVDGFYYLKDKKTGAISDQRADLPESYVGMEFDLSVTWRPLSDVLASIRYGLFLPGDAYSSATNDARGFLSASLTYMF
jgi:hypothetical protein